MTTEKDKSLDEINQEIEEELRNYDSDKEEKPKRSVLFTKPRLIVLLVVLGLALYRLLHFFF